MAWAIASTAAAHYRRVMRAPTLVLVLAISACSSGSKNTPKKFFADNFAGYWIACSEGKNCALAEEKRAGLTPALLERVTAVGQAYPDGAKVKAAVADLNAALVAENVVIDVQPYRDTTLLIAYEVVSRHAWKHGDKQIPVLRVHRLDHTNIVTSWLGHAGRSEPVVLLDRIEVALLNSLRNQKNKDGNIVDEAVKKTWRQLAERATSAAATEAAVNALAKRDDLHKKLEDTFASKRVNVPYPERFLLGEEYFERLNPYADPKRNGGPLFMRQDLKQLRAADRALAEDDLFKALTTLRDIEASATEAHEVFHVVHGELDPSLVPGEIMEALGDDDLEFGIAADQELRAYLGELHAGEAPACLALGRLAKILAGERSSRTPHHYAARVLFKNLRGDWLTSPSAVVAAVEELCALDDKALRQKAADAWKSIYKEPIPAVTRVQ